MSYLPRVKIVGTKVGPPGGYLQEVLIVGWEDEKGKPFDPIPPPPPEDLTLNTPTETAGSTDLGSTLTGTPATFTGGKPPVVVETKWERSVDNTLSTWVNVTEYQEGGPTTYTTVAADDDRYLRFVTQATDDDGNVITSSGNAIGLMEAALIETVAAPDYSVDGVLNTGEMTTAQTAVMISGSFTGGFGTLTNEYRWRYKVGGAGSWINRPWQSSVPSVVGTDPLLTVGDTFQFQQRATDELGNSKTSTATPLINLLAATTIGTISLAPPATTANAGDTVTFDVIISGDASPTYTWSIRSGPASFVGGTTGTQVQVQVDAGASSGASIQVQVDAVDNAASDSPKGTLATIIVN